MSFKPISLIAGIALITCVAQAKAASVDTLSNPTYSGNLQNGYDGYSDGTSSTSGSTVNFTGQNISLSYSGAGSASTNTIISFAAPALSISGSTNGPAAYSQGNPSLTYQFEVIGPSGSVPIFVSAAGTASGTGIVYYDELSALLSISGGSIGGTGGNPYAGIFENTAGPGSWTLNGTYQFQANTIYTVTLSVNGGSSVGLGESGSYSASVDPTFEITDPDYANLYSLDFSPGIENVATTPLPSSWTMMSSAFAFFAGLVLFRRKSVATA